ncbi:diacylglycerol/lipid kinase family protein [Weissella muntiaci]|nr:YegS/Rv2252/BmrU family lipid kinase [Weissella muntiaci]
MKKYLVVFNGAAGKSNNRAIAEHFKKIAESSERKVRLVATKSREDALKQIEQQAHAIDYIIVIGGDGSINTVFSALNRVGIMVPVGIIPAGTVNNYAKALHIPLDVDAAIQVILAEHKRSVDIANDGERAMVSSALIGTFADIANHVKQSEKKKLGPLAFLIQAFKQGIFKKPASYRLTPDDGPEKTIATALIIITLTNSLGGYTKFNLESQPSDGKVSVVILKEFNLLRLPSYFSYLMHGRIGKAQDILSFKTKGLKIERIDQQATKVRIDGDRAEPLPLRLQVNQVQATVLVPARDDQ